jgi:hypothetical protein
MSTFFLIDVFVFLIFGSYISEGLSYVQSIFALAGGSSLEGIWQSFVILPSIPKSGVLRLGRWPNTLRFYPGISSNNS